MNTGDVNYFESSCQNQINLIECMECENENVDFVGTSLNQWMYF